MISENDFVLRPFDEKDYEGFVSLNNLLYPDHPGSVANLRHNDKTREKKIRHRNWVWEMDGKILTSAIHTQFAESFHPQRFVIGIYIHPEFQGKGYGAACYDHLLQKLEKFDPIKITCIVHEPHKRGIRFFQDRGFVQTMKEKESSLDLTGYDPEQYQDEVDRVLMQNLRIMTLAEFRQEDADADHKVWELERDVSPDMPWTDPISIPEFNVFKQHVLAHPKFNPDSWFLVLDGNHIVGLNNLWKSEIERGINTGLTGVRREYRRKGLATALKHTCLTWARNQDYEWIRTDNVATNSGMLSINIRVGFKFMPAWLVYEKIIKEGE